MKAITESESFKPRATLLIWEGTIPKFREFASIDICRLAFDLEVEKIRRGESNVWALDYRYGDVKNMRRSIRSYTKETNEITDWEKATY
jgi:hypothetical protein